MAAGAAEGRDGHAEGYRVQDEHAGAGEGGDHGENPGAEAELVGGTAGLSVAEEQEETQAVDGAKRACDEQGTEDEDEGSNHIDFYFADRVMRSLYAYAGGIGREFVACAGARSQSGVVAAALHSHMGAEKLQ